MHDSVRMGLVLVEGEDSAVVKSSVGRVFASVLLVQDMLVAFWRQVAAVIQIRLYVLLEVLSLPLLSVARLSKLGLTMD